MNPAQILNEIGFNVEFERLERIIEVSAVIRYEGHGHEW